MSSEQQQQPQQQHQQQPQHQQQHQQQPQYQQPDSVVTSQPQKGSPPQVYTGGYPAPPYTQPYPGQPLPAYPIAPVMAPNMTQANTNMSVINPVMMPQMQVPVQQQQMTNVNVNTNQRRVYRAWKANFCACCKDPIGCLGAMICFPCFLCWLSTQLDEACFTPVCVPYALPALRLKFRTAQRLKGSICEDCLLVTCGFAMCVACQMKRELDMLGDPLNVKLQKIHAP